MQWDQWRGDVRVAMRNAIRRPGFTLLIVVTLALGLGVNSAVFTLVDAVLLRPLPYRDPSRLVFVWQTLPQHDVFEVEATPFDYAAWHSLRSLSDVAMVNYGTFTLTGGSAEPERLRGARVTASLLPMLGLSPALGRGFTIAEDGDGAPATVILSEGLWHRRYGADPAIVGRAIEVDAEPRVVVGVMPRGASLPDTFGEDRDLWLPMRLSPSERALESSHNYTIFGRLAPGVTYGQASAELATFAARMASERPSHRNIGARLATLDERTARQTRPSLVVAAAGVALLLLVAAANASTLLMARAANRRRELAVRAAMGATRLQLLSLSVAESLIFTFLGAAAALVLGAWTLRGLVALFSSSIPRGLPIAVDLRTVGFTAALGLAMSLVFALVSAYRPGTRLTDALGAARSAACARPGRARAALVVVQVGLAVVLLSFAGLMLGSVRKLSRVDPGFAADHVVTARVTLTGARYDAPQARVGFVSTVIDRLRVAGSDAGPVQSAGVVSVVPLGGMRNATVVQIEGRPAVPGAPSMIIDQRHVSPGYFETMRIPVLRGRLIDAADDARSERVTVINHTMAARYFPDEDPLNRRIRITGGFESGVMRIVGVVGDVRHLSLDRDPVPEMYHPIAQTAVPTFTLVARTIGDPASMAPAVGAAVRGIDPDLPIYEVRTMDDRIAGSFAQTRATMLLLMATAALAAALAAVAVYGSIWYSVVQRTPEIGIRVALGASRATVFGDVVGAALRLGAIGAALGIATAVASGRLLQTLLFETRAGDPRTHVSVAIGVLALTALASLAPAIRATRIDPLRALRE